MFAVAERLGMTANDVRVRMDAHELFTWAYLLFPSEAEPSGEESDAPVLLSVEDEIAAWGS